MHTYANSKAEINVISAMLNGLAEQVMDLVDLTLFQTSEGKDAAYKIMVQSQKGPITVKQMVNVYSGDSEMQDYIHLASKQECDDVKELEYFVQEMRLAKIKTVGDEHARKIINLANSDRCDYDEMAQLLQNGTTVEMHDAKPLFELPENYAGNHFNKYLERVKNPEANQGIRIKFLPELDKTFFGLKGGDLIMVCAESGKGKTALALNVAKDISIDQGHRLYYPNAEMQTEELTNRIVSNMTQVPATEIMSGQHDKVGDKLMEVIHAVSEAYDTIGKSNLCLSRIPTMTMKSIRRGYKKLKTLGRPPEIMIIDYIGRMELDEPAPGLNEWQILYKLAEASKTLAVELNIPVIVLAQLNEDGKIEGAKKMKNACDGVLFFEPVTEDDKQYMSNKQKLYANYKIVKYKVRRNDNSKPIYVHFNKSIQKIGEVQ